MAFFSSTSSKTTITCSTSGCRSAAASTTIEQDILSHHHTQLSCWWSDSLQRTEHHEYFAWSPDSPHHHFVACAIYMNTNQKIPVSISLDMTEMYTKTGRNSQAWCFSDILRTSNLTILKVTAHNWIVQMTLMLWYYCKYIQRKKCPISWTTEVRLK